MCIELERRELAAPWCSTFRRWGCRRKSFGVVFSEYRINRRPSEKPQYSLGNSASAAFAEMRSDTGPFGVSEPKRPAAVS